MTDFVMDVKTQQQQSLSEAIDHKKLLQKINSLSSIELEELVERCIARQMPRLAALQKEYAEQDEFVYINDFFPMDVLQNYFLPGVEHSKQFINRSYIPMHKKGGSVSSFLLSQHAPIFVRLYHSRAFLRFLYQIIYHSGSITEPATSSSSTKHETKSGDDQTTNEQKSTATNEQQQLLFHTLTKEEQDAEVNDHIMICPEGDPHAVALYYYTEPGDHIGFHYDSSFYKGIRYTLLMGLVDRSSCRLVCNLHTRNNHRNSTVRYNSGRGQLINAQNPVETRHVKIEPGAIVLFNGDKLYHAVTPLKKGEERVVLTMEFVTNQEMGMVERALSNMKDCVAYFGLGSLIGWNSATNTTSAITPLEKEETYRESLENSSAQDELSISEGSVEEEIEDVSTKPNIVIFVNKLSGGQRGEEVIPRLVSILGPNRVYDLNEMGGPEPGLLQHLNTPNLRVVACGGDGTIRWVIQGLVNCGIKPLPPLGVLPLGTGNDLSRMFGWGPGYKGESLEDILHNMMTAQSKPMDLWTCSLKPWNPTTGEMKDAPDNSQIMFNYFNIGFDPQVAYGFHSLRLSNPELFKARAINKGWYMLYALGNILRGSYQLQDVCTISIDGKDLTIPYGVKTIVILNFVCYQAGADIWGQDEKDDYSAKMDDGIVEVIGINGVYHEAMIRMYMSAGIRLGRGKEVQLKVVKPIEMPMAFDGEPFMHEPAVITIRPFTQIQVLQHPDGTPYDV